MDQCATLDHHHHHRRFSWTAVIIGAVVGVGLGFLLNLFSIAIGLSAYTTSPQGLMTLAVGGLIGLLIGVIASMFVMGWVAGYLGRPCGVRSWYGALYGFAAWCFSLILTILLAASIANFVGAYSQFIMSPVHQVQVNKDTIETKNVQTGAKNVASTEKAANDAGMNAFVVFILFFVGALSACFGGQCGYSCHENERDEVRTV